MRYALIIAGGAGTRLWPMSRAERPKQLAPFIQGKSLLQIAWQRLDGLIPPERRYVCAARQHQAAVLAAVPGATAAQFLGEPVGRDTLAAVGLGAAVLSARDPEAVIAVFTADHLIEPVADFQRIVTRGFELVEQNPNTLVTFGITPSHPATGYGYLELGPAIGADARRVARFREKPPPAEAERYFGEGPERYLWNSGMFVWPARTLLDCIGRYEPAAWEGLMAAARAWETADRDKTLDRIYPALRKISVDFAVMEPASRDSAVRVAALPMPLRWLDVGSWTSFAESCPRDEQQNALAAARYMLHETVGCLVTSDDPEHLIALIGCRDLVVVHTATATLVCRADMAEKVKEIQQAVEERFGRRYT